MKNIDEDFDPNEPIECPICFSDAYWVGGNYACDNCGWCSDCDYDEDEYGKRDDDDDDDY